MGGRNLDFNARRLTFGRSKHRPWLGGERLGYHQTNPSRKQNGEAGINLDLNQPAIMYSPQVLDHLENPRHVGEMADASACGEATNPVCGDLLQLYLKISEGRITAASFKAHGCPPTLAAASALTEMVIDLTLDGASRLTPADVTRALGTLPRHKEHCAVLAMDALRAALADYQPDVV